jgi:hypothetical protein
VASNIKHVPVSIDYIRDEHAELINDYNYPFSSVELFNESFSLNYKGKFFIATKAKLAQNQALDYYLYTKSDEQPDANGTRNIYLQAQLPGTQSGTQDITEVRALDISRMFYSSGRDTTIYDGSISYSLKYLKINLQYCSKIENEAPVFNSVNEQPLVIYALRDDL